MRGSKRASKEAGMSRNPLRGLRYLPWVPLLIVAAMTVVLVSILEILLVLAAAYVPLIAQSVNLLFTPPLGMLMVVAIAMGVGAIAVYILETVRRDVVISSGVLWALVGCLILAVFLRQVLPFPSLVSAAQPSIIGMMLGVFFKGRRYWR